MNFAAAQTLARQGQLYPAVILHGGSLERRLATAVELARTLLCLADEPERPCGVCRHCRRIAWPPDREVTFHPDFQLLERDLKTATSVEATKRFLRTAHVSPFEARGQVFILANAETLTGEAANALLKMLEEPATSAPRNFLLLSPSSLDLLPTLRSRSLAIYLGPEEGLEQGAIREGAGELASCLNAYAEGGSPSYLLAATQVLLETGGWEDPRAAKPWALAAATVLEAREGHGVTQVLKPGLLALAEDLLTGPQIRVRGIPARRIVEGFVTRHLSG